MSSQSNAGLVGRSTGITKAEGTSSAGLTKSEQIAGSAWQICREFFPVGPQESDAALKLRLELLAEIVDAVGPEKFNEAVMQALRISRSRYEVSVQRIRELAGLYAGPPMSAAARAWQQVMEIVAKHVRRDPEGNYRLEPYVRMDGGQGVMEPVPKIPANVLKAVRSLGGWAALVKTDEEYLAQRYRDFREMFEE